MGPSPTRRNLTHASPASHPRPDRRPRRRSPPGEERDGRCARRGAGDRRARGKARGPLRPLRGASPPSARGWEAPAVIRIRDDLRPAELRRRIDRLWSASGEKIRSIETTFDPARGAPVFTVEGRYTTQGWTEWTQGFQFGSAILQYDAAGDEAFLEMGRRATRERMAPHLTHFGVHDHGFNNVSTYGNLLRLMNEGRIAENEWERELYTLALKISGAVQARRWTRIAADRGYVYSFNGPHSLFADTIRSMRSLALSHSLGHVLMDENDRAVSLLDRLIQHARTTAEHIVYYGEGRDAYDVRGRVAHEAIFNPSDGSFRCPSTQQGYSPLSTWTRGLAWIICGYAEELEYIETLSDEELEPFGGRGTVVDEFLRAARASADFYIESTPADGIPYWDTGAPGLCRLGDYLDRPADPYNEHEPVDSSAAAIAAQGLLRLGRCLMAGSGEEAVEDGKRYWAAGWTAAGALFDAPYLCEDPAHQGLILHSVYHRPRGWDHVPAG
ncbi:MAG: glycoside hydrolase family 88 protein, partial [Planctomycetes bacterium]|nr:glycoside hydrolase family 88 protein [Planctomycetota bacterium]